MLESVFKSVYGRGYGCNSVHYFLYGLEEAHGGRKGRVKLNVAHSRLQEGSYCHYCF